MQMIIILLLSKVLFVCSLHTFKCILPATMRKIEQLPTIDARPRDPQSWWLWMKATLDNQSRLRRTFSSAENSTGKCLDQQFGTIDARISHFLRICCEDPLFGFYSLDCCCLLQNTQWYWMWRRSEDCWQSRCARCWCREIDVPSGWLFSSESSSGILMDGVRLSSSISPLFFLCKCPCSVPYTMRCVGIWCIALVLCRAENTVRLCIINCTATPWPSYTKVLIWWSEIYRDIVWLAPYPRTRNSPLNRFPC